VLSMVPRMVASPQAAAPPEAAASPGAAGEARLIESAMAPEPAVVGPDARWDALKQRLPKPVASLLTDARLAAASDGLVRIEFRYPAHADLMGRASNREALLAAVREIFGAEMRLELVAAEKKPSPPPAPSRPAGSIVDDPLVKEAMNRFDATNVRVTPRGRG
jgi:hypothetical protein